MPSKICFISASPDSTALYREVLERIPEAPPIFGGDIEGALAAALTAIKEGYDIFVTNERTARHLWGKVDTPIVAFAITPFDIARSLHQAHERFGDPVAFFEMPLARSSHLPLIRKLLQIDFREFVFTNRQEGLAKLRQAFQEGVCAVVGGATITALAREKGFPCVPLLPSREDLLRTFQQAQQIASVRQVEERQEMKFKSVVQYSFSGIIVTDEEGRIAVYNQAAEKLFAMPAERVIGQRLGDVISVSQLPGSNDTALQLEELRKIQNRQLLVNRIPILAEGRLSGTIFTFQEVSNIQSMEEKIRRAGQVKGLTARHRFPDIIGASRVLREAVVRAQRFAATDETILITGESGTGKEVFAQSIHNSSARSAHPFLAVNCSAISPSLLESELFGYAEGAFTGARRGGRQGMFELAHQGTIFLDEIGELSREAQGHLLRVLQEKEVMRVGDAKITPINVRVIAATNRPLEQDVRKGLFRWDLYHRLNVLQLRLPPLREHAADILPLAEGFVAQTCQDRRLAARIGAAFSRHEALLAAYPWPGNVRELQNLLRRIVALVATVQGDAVEREIGELLAEIVSTPLAITPRLPKRGRCRLKSTLNQVAADIVRKQQETSQLSKKELARKLGIGRTTLWRRLKEAEEK